MDSERISSVLELASEGDNARLFRKKLKKLPTEKVKAFLKETETTEHSFLYTYVASGYIKVVKVLLDYGCDPNYRRESDKMTPTMMAAFSVREIPESTQEHFLVNNFVSIFEVLTSHSSFDIEKSWYTPLQVACLTANYEMIISLFQNGTNPNEISYDGCTPITQAVWAAGDPKRLERSKKIISALVDHPLFDLRQKHDEECNCCRNQGRGNISPLIVAMNRRWKGGADYMLPVVELLLGKGFEANVYHNGTSALTYAVMMGHLKCAQRLVQAGADIHIKSTISSVCGTEFGSQIVSALDVCKKLHGSDAAEKLKAEAKQSNNSTAIEEMGPDASEEWIIKQLDEKYEKIRANVDLTTAPASKWTIETDEMKFAECCLTLQPRAYYVTAIRELPPETVLIPPDSFAKVGAYEHQFRGQKAFVIQSRVKEPRGIIPETYYLCGEVILSKSDVLHLAHQYQVDHLGCASFECWWTNYPHHSVSEHKNVPEKWTKWPDSRATLQCPVCQNIAEPEPNEEDEENTIYILAMQALAQLPIDQNKSKKQDKGVLGNITIRFVPRLFCLQCFIDFVDGMCFSREKDGKFDGWNQVYPDVIAELRWNKDTLFCVWNLIILFEQHGYLPAFSKNFAQDISLRYGGKLSDSRTERKYGAPVSTKVDFAKMKGCALPGCDIGKTINKQFIKPEDMKIEKLLMCSGCKGAYYCSAKHQKADWSRHKAACKKAKKEPNPRRRVEVERPRGWRYYLPGTTARHRTNKSQNGILAGGDSLRFDGASSDKEETMKYIKNREKAFAHGQLKAWQEKMSSPGYVRPRGGKMISEYETLQNILNQLLDESYCKNSDTANLTLKSLSESIQGSLETECFIEGDKVEIHSLKKAPMHNGRVGSVAGISKNGRYKVEFQADPEPKSKTLLIKKENLRYFSDENTSK